MPEAWANEAGEDTSLGLVYANTAETGVILSTIAEATGGDSTLIDEITE